MDPTIPIDSAPGTAAPEAPVSGAPAPGPVASPEPEPEPEPATEPKPESVIKSEPEEEEDKPKKHLSKKAKIAIIVSSIVVVLLGIAALLVFVVFKKEEPVVILTDRDILVSKSWEKQDAPTVIWTFRADGTGELTTNKTNYYDTKWTLSDDEPATLEITTAWLYELKDSFTFTLDREANTFTVKKLSDDTESVFVPLGTAETAAKEALEEPAELEKSE
jgi:flagellar basal body-associated protein FliL